MYKSMYESAGVIENMFSSESIFSFKGNKEFVVMPESQRALNFS